MACSYGTFQEQTLEIEALRRRDPDALNRLVKGQAERLHRVILGMVHDPDEAQSLVQETFLQALQSLDAFRGHAKISTWIYSIALNVTRTHLRKNRRVKVLSGEVIEALQPVFSARGEHTENYPAWNPERVTEKRERSRLLYAAIDQLPEMYRVIVTMRDLEERTTAEVAEALSISEENVRVRLHRARNVLRKLLTPYFAAPEARAV